jgi:hypothetical protein
MASEFPAIHPGWIEFPDSLRDSGHTFPENLRKGTLVVVTFDESGGNKDNRIFTLLLGDRVKPAKQQDPASLAKHYTHYSVLRTIEDNFGLEPLTANDREAQPMIGIWKSGSRP